jgi:hypothetical protein
VQLAAFELAPGAPPAAILQRCVRNQGQTVPPVTPMVGVVDTAAVVVTNPLKLVQVGTKWGFKIATK